MFIRRYEERLQSTSAEGVLSSAFGCFGENRNEFVSQGHFREPLANMENHFAETGMNKLYKETAIGNSFDNHVFPHHLVLKNSTNNDCSSDKQQRNTSSISDNNGKPEPKNEMREDQSEVVTDIVHNIPEIVEEKEQSAELDIIINNVVCSFSVRCHLNLKHIAQEASNVEYRRENGLVRMKIRKPNSTASISSSGKITCTGATSEQEAKKAARRFARSLQKLGFNVKFTNYRIVNVLGTCTMPWNIKITLFSQHHKEADYEPELHPGVTYKIKHLKATLKIFSTGSLTVTAPSIEAVQTAIELIYPLVYEFRKERTEQEQLCIDNKKALKRSRELENMSDPEELLEEPEEDED